LHGNGRLMLSADAGEALTSFLYFAHE
jgi:hypothetical protein